MKDGKWICPTEKDGKVKSRYQDYGSSGQTEMDIKSVADVEKVMELIQSTRQAKSHALNERSSRSFCIIVITYTQKNNGRIKKSKFNILDLAGSERIFKSQSEGRACQEAVGINTALSALGRCIQEIVKKSKVIPYRDSPLTLIMKDSLTGNCKTSLIVTIAQDPTMMQETYSTLRFGSVCGSVKTTGQVKSVSISKQLDQYKATLNEVNKQLAGMRDMGWHGGFDPTAPKCTCDAFRENYKNLRLNEKKLEQVGCKIASSDTSKSETELKKQKEQILFAVNNLRGILARQITTKIWTEPRDVYITKMRQKIFLE